MKIKALVDRFALALAPPVAAGVIRLLHLLIRVEFLGEEALRERWDRGEHVILAFWHDQLLLMALGYRGPGSKILISSSKDGELIARTMGWFGQGAVRGSSHRGGRAAFKALVALGSEPFDLVITPDGPRGPRHQIKDGVVQLARLTGRPVVPMAFVCSRGRRFASWDKFLLPYPLARGIYSFGEGISFLQGEDPEDFRNRLNEAMLANNRKAMARLEDHGVSAI